MRPEGLKNLVVDPHLHGDRDVIPPDVIAAPSTETFTAKSSLGTTRPSLIVKSIGVSACAQDTGASAAPIHSNPPISFLGVDFFRFFFMFPPSFRFRLVMKD